MSISSAPAATASRASSGLIAERCLPDGNPTTEAMSYSPVRNDFAVATTARDAVHWTNLPTPWWAGLASQQEGRTQSTGTSHRQDQPAGLARAGSHHLMASAERRARHSAHHDS